MKQEEREEKLGQAVMGISWILFALRFIVVTGLLALAGLYVLKKPLWLAPVIAIAAFVAYRLIYSLIWKLIELGTRQK
ncbi:MAG: hypothetical protein K6E63_04220 [Lachnospiraceae bacterium]|nr:hypothetical protein [Lachnospiraceae bacterium]